MNWCCIAAVNDTAILKANLAASPVLRADLGRLVTLHDQPSASIAYNAGLDLTAARICVFAHQDVYLPCGWEERLADLVARLDQRDPTWAVAGLFGVDRAGSHVGRVWSTGIGKELGEAFERPIEVQSIDELLIVLDRSKGLRFDEALPGFHMYGTDIVQQARSKGFGSYVIHAPVVHNSQRVRTLHGPFMRAHDYVSKKWKKQLPIKTPVTTITRFGLKARLQAMKLSIRTAREGKSNPRRRDPVIISTQLGYE